MHKEHHGFLWGILAALASAGMALFVKLSTSVSVATLIFSRFALGVPIILWVIYQKKLPITWEKVPKNLIRSLGSIIALYAYFYSIQMLPIVNAITLTNTAPLFLPFIALIWLKLIVSKQRFLAVAVGFVGIIILLHPTSSFVEIGSLLGLASGLFGAIALMSIRQLSKTESTEMILAYYFLIGTVLSFFPIFFDWKPISDPLQWLYLFLTGFFALIYQYAITKSYTHAPATKVSTMNYLSVVFGGLLGWWVFGEVPDYWVLAGTLLIISGALIALFDRTPPREIGKT